MPASRLCFHLYVLAVVRSVTYITFIALIVIDLRSFKKVFWCGLNCLVVFYTVVCQHGKCL